MSRRRAPTQQEIEDAIGRAMNGKGRQLALMVKACSVDDLTRAFSIGGRSSNAWGLGRIEFAGLSYVLNAAAGMAEERARTNGILRDIRKRERAIRKAAEAAP